MVLHCPISDALCSYSNQNCAVSLGQNSNSRNRSKQIAQETSDEVTMQEQVNRARLDFPTNCAGTKGKERPLSKPHSVQD